MNVGDFVWGEVREATVFEIGPELLDGVQVRGVGREPLHVPPGMSLEEPSNKVMLVGPTSVPEEEEGTPIVPPKLAKKVQYLRAANVRLWMKTEVQRDTSAVRRNDEGADAHCTVVARDRSGQRSSLRHRDKNHSATCRSRR